jgi:tetratricopeptide (TPR) repeat protein
MKIRFRVALCCMASLLAGCAYFNTFYNARRYYNKAYQQVEKNRGKKNAAAVDKASFQKAAEKAAKLLEYYPNSKYADDALVLQGKSYYYLEEYQSAIRKFEELLADFPASDLRFDAELGLAKTHVALKQFDRAEELLGRMDMSRLSNRQRAEAFFYQGRLYEVKKEYDRAIEAFEKAVKTGDKTYRADAAFAMGDDFDSLRVFDKAAESFRQALKHDPLPEQRTETEFRLAVSLKKSGEFDESIRILERLLGDEKNKTREPEFRLEVGDCLARKGDIEGAVVTYQDITKANPKSVHSAKAYYALGRLYESRRGDYDRALDNYTMVKKEFPGRLLEGDSAEVKGRDIQRLRALEDVIDAAVHGSTGGEVEVDREREEAEEDTVDAFGKVVYSRADSLLADSLVYVEKVQSDASLRYRERAGLNRDAGQTTASAAADTASGGSADTARLARRTVPDWRLIDDFELEDKDYENFLDRARTERRRRKSMDKLAENPELKSFKKEELDKNRFLLGELYLFRFSMPDSAYLQYAALAEQFPESPYTAQALYIMHHLERRVFLDSLAADSTAAILFARHPETEFAKALRRERGLTAGTAEQDTVERLFREAEADLFDRNRPAEAVEIYRTIGTRFPKSEAAVKALYAQAWVYENGMDSLHQAFVLYDSLVRAFPGTAFAGKAKPKVDAFREEAAKPKAAEAQAADSTLRGAAADSTGRQAAADSAAAGADSTAGSGMTPVRPPPAALTDSTDALPRLRAPLDGDAPTGHRRMPVPGGPPPEIRPAGVGRPDSTNAPSQGEPGKPPRGSNPDPER